MRLLSQRLFPAVMGVLALGCMWFAVAELRQGGFNTGYVGLMSAGAVLFGLAACAVWFDWKSRRVLAFACGILLSLYAASVVLLGWEDVGGAVVAIPVALITGLAGVMGFVVSSSRPAGRGAT